MDFLKEKILKLKGKVQHYDWGGTAFIPQWMSVENAEKKPFAEYWLGTHLNAPSEIIIGDKAYSLAELIKKYLLEFLGERVKSQFNELPYLFKILDVKDILSIQVHPSKTQAQHGFENEEKTGIEITASHRNYKDKNHKPEIMVALSEFWLLHGFQPKSKLKAVLEEVPEFENLKNIFADENYKALYEHVMKLPQQEVNEILLPLIKKAIVLKESNQLTKEQPGWWVSKIYSQKKDFDKIDRGIFSIYFFNIVKINQGEAIFQAAGIPHAYLEGQNVELMSNSDNVLRGGLTSKHVDVNELLKHTLFEGIEPKIIKGNKFRQETNYPVPVADFGVSKIELNAGETYHAASSSLEIWIILEGEITFKDANKLKVQQGDAVAILANENYSATAHKNSIAFKAFVP